jgi:hypothetical protein
MATTYNFTNGSIAGVAKPHDTTPRGFSPFVLRNIVDFTKQTNVATDVIQVLNVPAGTLVLGVTLRVITVDAGGGTVDIGTGASTQIWGAACSLATGGAVLDSPLPFDAPTYFATADTIDFVTATAAITTGIVELTAVCIDVGTTVDAEG